jgi:arginine-tRNA-protein transferase
MTKASIRLYQTTLHPCGYWPDREARDLVLDPENDRLGQAYGQALEMGFRRSGGHIYRPHCPGCRQCVAIRLPVADFQPNRSQRRCLKRNADLTVTQAPAVRRSEHFGLYRRYLDSRHPGGGMDNPAPEDFDLFLRCRWSPTRFLEMRLGKRLLGVAVTDLVPNGLSAVYTFFDPEESERGLGTFAILSQVEWARRQRLDHLYLGYRIAGHPKMDYKTRFAPYELLHGGAWVRP